MTNTVTLKFDEQNLVAQKALDYMLSLNVFSITTAKNVGKGKKITRELTPEEEKEAFLHTSQLNVAEMMNKYRAVPKTTIAERLAGSISHEQAAVMNEELKQMRGEWNRNI